MGDYRALAEFRYELRRYLALSDHAARSVGLHPGQYRLLLMLKGLPDGIEPTIGNLAERLGLRHHSTVELVDRLEKRGLIHRERN
ncbi:MAG: MarR family transcriptional regulator, partial [Acidobacteria bacterium]